VDVIQEIDLKQSVALELVFHLLPQKELLMALGMDSGEVSLFGQEPNSNSSQNQLTKMCSLKKHEDWVRCITFSSLGKRRRHIPYCFFYLFLVKSR
jgi:hypothetical protein